MDSPTSEEKPRRRRTSLKIGGTRAKSKRVLSRSDSIPASPDGRRSRSLPPTPTESRFERLYDLVAEKISFDFLKRFDFKSRFDFRESQIMDTAREISPTIYERAAALGPYVLAIPSCLFAIINLAVFNVLLSVLLEIGTSFFKKFTASPSSSYISPPNVIPSSSFYSMSSKTFSLALSTELSLLFGSLLLSRRTRANKYVHDRVYDAMGLLWAVSGVVTSWILGTLFLLGLASILMWLLLISGSAWIAVIVEEVMKVLRNGLLGLLKMTGAGWVATRAVEAALGFLKI